jgi:hypothetical protein
METTGRLRQMAEGPHAAALANEIPPGSVMLGSGAEATAVRAPDGSVIRIGGGPDTRDLRSFGNYGEKPPPPRLRDPQVMLQPVRDVTVGPYRVERMPFVDIASGRDDWDQLAPDVIERYKQLSDDAHLAGPQLATEVEQAGYVTQDLADNLGNFGRTPEGRWLVTDPSSATLRYGKFPEEALPPLERQVSRSEQTILDLLGASRAVQGEISQGLARGVPPGAGFEIARPTTEDIMKWWNEIPVGDQMMNLASPSAHTPNLRVPQLQGAGDVIRVIERPGSPRMVVRDPVF